MDKTLMRILSLIPRKPNGKFEHGALKRFAMQLGFKDGHIISDWIAGNSQTYLKYLYEISAKYNVSVDWLRGTTDDPSPNSPSRESQGLSLESGVIVEYTNGQNEKPTTTGELSEKDIRLLNWFRSLPPETQKAILTLGAAPKELLEDHHET